MSHEISLWQALSAYNQARFLLARLHVDSLLDKSSKKKVLSTLAQLPKGTEALDKAYSDAIKRIEGQLSGHRTLATNVLSWITYAQRPLTTRELCHALAVEPGDLELDQDNIPDVEYMVSVCAGLVIIDDESKIIRLVHYTTQEYFERIRESWNPRAQQEIAIACLTYLSFNPFRSGACPNDEQLESRLERYTFLDYASPYWGHHIGKFQEQVCELASCFLQVTTLISCAVQITSIRESRYNDHSQHFPKDTTGLHITAGFGLMYLLERLLSEMGDVLADSKDSDGRTPLSQAAQQGHTAVVKLLVERDDVEADSEDQSSRTPLSYAAMEGHEEVVQLLIMRDDVDADSNDSVDSTPLLWAASQGNEAVVRLLVERDDVEVNVRNSWGMTPLSYAAMEGHKITVQLLVERDDVETDSRNEFGNTPLSLAAMRGNEAVVRLLVERDDVEADARNRWGMTPLSLTACEGHETVVRLLAERGDVNADSKDNTGRTPLSNAAGEGHEAVVRLLLERFNVEVDSKDNDGRTPLWYTEDGGHEAVMKLLRTFITARFITM